MVRLFGIVVALFWAAAAIAQSGYQIRTGDLLAIEVLEDESLNREALVLPDGSISFPLVGSISARGKTTDALRRDLAGALAPNFATIPSVFVSVAEIREREVNPSAGMIDVFVMGEVVTPGLVEVKRGTTLLQTLAQSGGFTRFAATKRIQLRRVDPQSGATIPYQFNYRALEAGAQLSGHIVLVDGDVIIVPQRRLFE